jgi:mono/diheme cytochrome c family protein
MKRLILIPALFLVSCNSQLYIPLQEVNSISVENLKKGRDLYVNNCSSCHQLYLPNQYNNKAWQYNLDQMQTKAKITDDQKKLIYDYLINAPK